MASVVSINEYDDEKLVISCQPSSRSWAICLGMYSLSVLTKSTLLNIVDSIVCQISWPSNEIYVYFSNSCCSL